MDWVKECTFWTPCMGNQSDNQQRHCARTVLVFPIQIKKLCLYNKFDDFGWFYHWVSNSQGSISDLSNLDAYFQAESTIRWVHSRKMDKDVFLLSCPACGTITL